MVFLDTLCLLAQGDVAAGTNVGGCGSTWLVLALRDVQIDNWFGDLSFGLCYGGRNLKVMENKGDRKALRGSIYMLAGARPKMLVLSLITFIMIIHILFYKFSAVGWEKVRKSNVTKDGGKAGEEQRLRSIALIHQRMENGRAKAMLLKTRGEGRGKTKSEINCVDTR